MENGDGRRARSGNNREHRHHGLLLVPAHWFIHEGKTAAAGAGQGRGCEVSTNFSSSAWVLHSRGTRSERTLLQLRYVGVHLLHVCARDRLVARVGVVVERRMAIRGDGDGDGGRRLSWFASASAEGAKCPAVRGALNLNGRLAHPSPIWRMVNGSAHCTAKAKTPTQSPAHSTCVCVLQRVKREESRELNPQPREREAQQPPQCQEPQ